MENKKSTDELKKILKASKTYDDFFEDEKEELIFKSISEYIKIVMSNKKIKAYSQKQPRQGLHLSDYKGRQKASVKGCCAVTRFRARP